MSRSLSPRRAVTPVLTGVIAEIVFAMAIGLAGIMICAIALWIAKIV